MYSFHYHRATNLADAEQVLAASSDGRFLAGGQTLLAALKMRLAQPDQLVDLGKVQGLHGVNATASVVSIGAMTTHAEVAASAPLQAAFPALAALAGQIADPMVRHRGTIGGSLANNDPSADYPAAVLAMGATVVTTRRRIAAADFFRGLFETALQPGEIITTVEFPVPRRAAYLKFRHPASRFALVGVFVADTAGGARVAVTGAGAGVFRATPMERALDQRFAAESLRGVSIDPGELNSDLHASAEYRAHLVGVLAARAVRAALAS